jgi:hypothetical protein
MVAAIVWSLSILSLDGSPLPQPSIMIRIDQYSTDSIELSGDSAMVTAFIEQIEILGPRMFNYVIDKSAKSSFNLTFGRLYSKEIAGGHGLFYWSPVVTGVTSSLSMSLVRDIDGFCLNKPGSCLVSQYIYQESSTMDRDDAYLEI